MIRKASERVHKIGFHHAWHGIAYSFTSQPNFRIHTFVSAIVVFLMFYLGVSSTEKIVLVFAIVLGLVVEMVNTAVESVVDLVTEEWRENAKIAKDVSAGAMLLTAVGTSIVGILVFWPYLAGYF